MTARDRRALLLGGSVMLGALVALRGAPSVVRHYANLRARTAEWVVMLERARSLLAAAPATGDSLSVAAQQIVALAPKLVAGETAGDAAANLTSELALAADRAGLRVVGLNALPDTAPGTFVPVVLRGQIEGDIKGLAAFLRAVEGGPTLLTIKSLQVMAADALEQQATPEQLRVEVVIAGWRLSRSTS